MELFSSTVDTCSPGIKRGSFSTKRSSATPAFKMDLVIPPGPGPTSHTWASFSSPAFLTILSEKKEKYRQGFSSARHRAHEELQFYNKEIQKSDQ